MTEPMTMRARVRAPVKTVHHALTEASQLRIWLTDHVEVDLPSHYAFWGPYIPDGDAPHQQLLDVDDRLLRFTWRLDGHDTTVEIHLADDAESTVIILSQTHFDLSDPGPRGMLQTFWAAALANLVDHLEDRPLTPRCDYTSAELRADAVIDARTAAVYESLVDAGQVSQWFGFPIEIDPQVGGAYGFAKILDLDPDRKLSVDFGGVGVVTWELAESEGKTRLTLVQSGFDPTDPPYAAWAGGLSGLAELRRFHEIADWQPIWISDPASHPAEPHLRRK